MVKPEHRINAKQLVEHLKKLLLQENRIDDPTDEIQRIFEKISIWKKKAGDLDEQEKMVAKRLKPIQPLKIHNIVTI